MHPRKIGLHFQGFTKPQKGDEFTGISAPVVGEVRVKSGWSQLARSPKHVGRALCSAHD